MTLTRLSRLALGVLAVGLLVLLGGTTALAQAPVSWSGLAGATSPPPYRLEVHIDHDPQLVHFVDVGLRGTPEALEAVQQVAYTFLPAALDARAWAAGEVVPEIAGSTVMTVGVRGDTADGVAFERRRETLGWLPVQVVATLVYQKAGELETLRLGPAGFELPDPSIRVGFQPVYETKLMASDEGLLRIPALTSIKLHVARSPERPEALDGVTRIGVAIGRAGDLHGVAPSFETWTLEQLREAKGRLHLGSIANRRGAPTMGRGDRRDFIWVVTVDAQGRAESYATWRPQFLRETLSPEAAQGARASEELHPFTRTTPAPPAPEAP